MKKLLLIFLCFPLIFTACKKEKEETNPNSPFIGYWSGNYYEEDSTTQIGIWDGNISSSGEITGSALPVVAGATEVLTLIGTVTNSGIFDAAIGTGDYGVTFDGQLNGNYGSGEWNSSIDGSTGFFEGHNYNQ